MMKKEQKPEVVIYKGRRWDYFEWFILGFYELEKSGKINFKFKPSLSNRLLALFNNELLLKKRIDNDLYDKYVGLAKDQDKIIFGGRLGQYKYYNMDQVIAAALDAVNNEFGD